MSIKRRIEILWEDKKKLVLLFVIPWAFALLSFAGLKYLNGGNADVTPISGGGVVPGTGVLPIPEETNPDTVTFTKTELYEREKQEEFQAGLDEKNQVSDREAFEVFLNTEKAKLEEKREERSSISRSGSGRESLYEISKKTKTGSGGNSKVPEKVEITPGSGYLVPSGTKPAESAPRASEVRRRAAPQTGGKVGQSMDRSSVGAVIHNWNKEIRNNSTVRIRTVEQFTVNGITIPVNSIITGTAQFNIDRLKITVSSINHNGQIIQVELSVYDNDGGEGLSVPATLAGDIAGSAADKGLDETKANVKIPFGVGDFSVGVGKKVKDNPAVSVPDGYRIILKAKK